MDIRKGEWIALLGSNGSGKSTFLKILSALLKPTQGVFSCFTDNACDKTKIEQWSGTAIVFQNPEDQAVALSVEEDTAFGPENIGMERTEIAKNVKNALNAVGLSGMENRLVSELSGGQKQRLALAGVLAMKPHTILLDEPLSMLDPQTRREFIKIIEKEHAAGKTIVQTGHSLKEIRSCTRVIILDKGRIKADMPRKEFFDLTAEEIKTLGFEKPALETLFEMMKNEGLTDKETIPCVQSATEILLCRSQRKI